MTWFKVDDQFPRHPKVLSAGTDAAWLFIAGGCYCAQYLTDGFIPKAALVGLTALRAPQRLAERLVAAGLWHDRGVEYEVHDYLAYNPSREQVESERQRRSDAGRIAATKRWASDSHSTTHTDRIDSSDAPVPSRTPKENSSSFEDEFAELWKHYPRKVDRAQALAKYQARRKDGIPHADLLAAVIAYAEASDGQDRQYVKHCATFLGARGSWSEWVNGPPSGAVPVLAVAPALNGEVPRCPICRNTGRVARGGVLVECDHQTEG